MDSARIVKQIYECRTAGKSKKELLGGVDVVKRNDIRSIKYRRRCNTWMSRYFECYVEFDTVFEVQH